MNCSQCDKESYCRGLCRTHYDRRYRAGKTPSSYQARDRIYLPTDLLKCSRCKTFKIADTNFYLGNGGNHKRKRPYSYWCKDCLRHHDETSSRRLKRYGITIEQRNEMLEQQQYCCAICGQHQSIFKKGLCVDHCHATGRIRGLLCSPCNQSLGMMADDVARLQKAIEYLEKP